MTELASPEQPLGMMGDLVPPRILASLFALAALIQVWRHGFRNWDWVMWVVLLGIVPLSGIPEPFSSKQRWPVRMLAYLWNAVFVAWIWHLVGWIPAVCLAVVSVFPPPKEKKSWWSPRLVVANLAIVVILIWLAHQTGEWVPIPCAGILVYLLSHEQEGRRSLKQNLLRPTFAAWIGITVASVVWSSIRPSFVHFALLGAILILWFGNLLLHLSSGERPLALSHPQS